MSLPDLSKLTVAGIRDLLNALGALDDALLGALEADPRAGVRNLALRERRRRRAEASERARLERMLAIERRLRARGVQHIAGVDEAGRGPLAGPVVAAAAILPEDALIPGLNDSKVLSPQRREALFEHIQRVALDFSIGQATAAEIDRINILQATYLAMRRALEGLSVPPDRVLVDGNGLPGGPYPEIAVVDGDATSLSIAAASIVAKVTRDRQMEAYDREYPAYGFAGHKGYGSREHLQALRQHGPCPIHRRSFQGVAGLHAGRSEDFQIFSEGIAQAADPAQLKAIGRSIAGARESLPSEEIEGLRKLYARRQKALTRTGRRGEDLAAEDLARRGYRILHRGYRAAGGEIDIVAHRQDILAFVEVKTATSSSFGPPETWVTPEKQRQIARVARAYLQRHTHPGWIPRFDVIALHLCEEGHSIRHIEGAFRIDARP